MLITDVRIRKVNYGRTRAYASLTIDDAFAVHDIKVIEGDNGLFILHIRIHFDVSLTQRRPHCNGRKELNTVIWVTVKKDK